MLKNFWYVCEFSAAITNKLKRITMLNQEIVIYRNSTGAVIAFLDECPHCGAALSKGRLENDCIRCLDHDGKFPSDGDCIEIPDNQPGVSIPKQARLNTYSVQEKYGLVWLFWGDLPENQRPPLPLVPEFGKSNWRPVYGEFRWNAHYTRVLENQFDVSHLPFVHSNCIGSGMVDQQQTEDYDVHIEQLRGSATVTVNQAKKVTPWSKAILQKQNSSLVRVKVSFYMPNISWLEFDFPVGNFKMIIFSVHLPIDANTTHSRWIVLRNFFTSSWIDGKVVKSAMKPLLEDKPIVESQDPKVVPDNLMDELHVPADKLSVAYRKLRKKCLEMGWGEKPGVNISGYPNADLPDSMIELFAMSKSATTSVD